MSFFARLRDAVKRLPRLTGWALFTAVLLAVVAVLAPHQISVVLYKLSLVTLGVVLAYWLDRALFPLQRPHELPNAELAVLAGIRRALVVAACVLGLTLGL
ncbi:hypothetical protein BFW38_06375 [Terasakiispira papahanaumokuakeensis]|uniref:Holin n=1 Tax=Terasakiispira papahanaumokuakeensis TaxID=197479 RepID=A0A1E2V8H4_9GAMM|nr:putative holin [Terasakiispira papahanaumokuakeensis]ODC03223.1 hypothetical protein BFW38_06375 [Terasakiispira papahanaumokuakeensis]